MTLPWVLVVPLLVTRRPALLAPLAASLVPILLAIPTPAYATGWVAVVLYIASDPELWRSLLRRRDHAHVLDGPRVPAGAVVGVQPE